MKIVHKFSNNSHIFKFEPYIRLFVTSGDGYWSAKKKNVYIFDAMLVTWTPLSEGCPTHGELRVFFNEDWNVYQDGYIYTDSRFLKELKEDFINLGFSQKAVEDIDYSEQGMQGNNFVSLDAGSIFTQQVISMHVINLIVGK